MKTAYEAPEVVTLGDASEKTQNGNQSNFDNQAEDTPAFS